MSDEQRRVLARAAGDGNLQAARLLVALLEREGHVSAHPDRQTRINFDRTERGFAVGEFLDRYGEKCSVQDSSIEATERCFWLGIDDPQPTHVVGGPSWISGRMHVGVKLARQLHTVIGRFLETGSVAPRNLPRKRRS